MKLFLMSAGVEVESITHEKDNVKKQLDEFTANNGIILACGTCIKNRNQPESEACPVDDGRLCKHDRVGGQSRNVLI